MYFFHASWLHSLIIMWSTVWSLSLPILLRIINFPFCSHVQVFLYAISPVYLSRWLQLYREGRLLPKECPVYDTKQSNDEVQVMLGPWGMRSIPSLPLLPGQLWPGMVAPDRSLSMGQIELNCILMLNWIVWNRTVWLNWIA